MMTFLKLKIAKISWIVSRLLKVKVSLLLSHIVGIKEGEFTATVGEKKSYFKWGFTIKNKFI